MSEEKKLALLIDSDNVSAKYAPFILQEASKYGELSVRRIYGDWEKGGNGWHFPALNNAILPIQQTCYIAGKNATDFSIIIDAMDLLHSGAVDGFVLVTSDSDFTRLAIRLREAGKLVVGIGEVKTPIAFTASCNHFSFLNQVCEPVGDDYDESTLRASLIDFVKNSGEKGTDLTKIDSFLTSKFGNIDYNRLGFNRLSHFVDSFPELRRNNTFVLMKKKKPAPAPAPAPAASESSVTRETIINLIMDHLSSHGGTSDVMQLDSMLTEKLGKIDYSRYGIPGKTSSKYFSKFLDNLPNIEREGNTVRSPRRTVSSIFEEMRKIIASYPDGINRGQLNQELVNRYGGQYYRKFGYSGFQKLLEDCPGLTLKKYDVFIEGDNADGKAPAVNPFAEETPVFPDAVEASAERSPYEEDASGEASPGSTSEEDAPRGAYSHEPSSGNAPSNLPASSFEKPEINSVKRFILSKTAENENGIVLPALGKLLSQRYGKGYLKELGFHILKQLVDGMNGVEIRDNFLVLTEEFITRTEEIEKFVYDFARGEGSHSVKALSLQIRKSFAGFDFTDYGYGKFSDFINAIDGVRANGYYVEPVD